MDDLREHIFVDSWHGRDAESNAWATCDRLARVLKKVGLTERYGMLVDKSVMREGRYSSLGYKLVLVDRTPHEPLPPAVRKIVIRKH